MLSEAQYRRLLEDANGLPRRDYITTFSALVCASAVLGLIWFYMMTISHVPVKALILGLGAGAFLTCIYISITAVSTRKTQAQQELAQYYEDIGLKSARNYLEN